METKIRQAVDILSIYDDNKLREKIGKLSEDDLRIMLFSAIKTIQGADGIADLERL